MSAGTFFTQAQDERGAKVVLLGPLIETALYGPDPNKALGQTLRINHALFTVIGMLPSYGASGNVIVMPLKA